MFEALEALEALVNRPGLTWLLTRKMVKRTYLEAFDTTRESTRHDAVEHDLHIVVPGGGRVPALSQVIKMFCSCARGLPTDATEWSLEGFLVDSKPVSQETVMRWLELCHARLGMNAAPSWPASLAQSRDLLLFADAVGTNDRIMTDWASQLAGMANISVDVATPGQQLPPPAASLELDKFYAVASGGAADTAAGTLHTKETHRPSRVVDIPDVHAFRNAVAAAFEEQLFLVNRLRGLTPLAKRLSTFVQDQLIAGELSVFHGKLPQVLSPRVLSVLNREVLLEGWLTSLMAAPRAEEATLIASTFVTLTYGTERLAIYFNSRPDEQDSFTYDPSTSLLSRDASAGGGALLACVFVPCHVRPADMEAVKKEVLDQYDDESPAR